MEMGLEFRPAREADLDRLVDVHTSAFADPRGRDARARNFTRNPLGTLDDLHVAIDRGQIVGHAFLFALEAWFGGARVRVGGVASVGVAPEARGRGVGSALLAHLHDRARDRGDAITMLYAFRQGYYARASYAPTSAYRRLRVDPRSIPWSAGDGALRTRAASGGDRAAMAECREATAARHTGALVRSDRAWEARLSDERRTWTVVEGARVEGYVALRAEQSEPHAKTTLVVDEMGWRDAAALRALWGVVGAQRDQVAEVRFDAAADDPIDSALVDADRARFGGADVEHVLGEVAAGPMVRVVDVARSLAARGWRADGSIVVQVGDARFDVLARDGRAAIDRSTGDPHVRTDARSFAAIAFGSLLPSHAARLGCLEARDSSSLALADAIFAAPAFFSPDPF